MVTTLTNDRILYGFACVFVAALLTGGCATGGGKDRAQAEASTPTLTSQEQTLRENENSFQRTVGEGAAIGGLIGGLVGLAVGGNARAAALGAGTGALIGGATGYYVAKRKEEFTTEEARVDSMIADVKQDNEKLQTYVATARQVIAADKKKLAEIKQLFESKQVSLDEARQRLSLVEENRDLIQTALTNLQVRHKDYAEAVEKARAESPTDNLRDMEVEIAAMEGNINSLERDLDELNEALAVTALG